MATGVGVVTVLLPLTALAVFAAWLVVLAASRYVSLASLAAVALLSVLRLTLTPAPFAWDHAVVTGFCLFGTALVFLRHAGNIKRLLQGSENRLKDSPAMLLFSKTIHVLALGLWFGTLCFFTVAGLLLFQAFDEISLKDKDARPLWFPLPEVYAKDPPSDKFPDPLRKEQGSRAPPGPPSGRCFRGTTASRPAAPAVTAITALGWWFSRRGSRVNAVRAVLLLAALAGVGVGWWLDYAVSDLRKPRDEKTDAVLLSAEPTDAQIQEAVDARATFVPLARLQLARQLRGAGAGRRVNGVGGAVPTEAPVCDALQKRS